jgi:putative ABC transport system permease protein
VTVVLAALLLLAAQHRTIAIDERLAADAALRVGDLVRLTADPLGPEDTARIAAIVGRRPDPSEVARSEYRVRLHLVHLQTLLGYDDRVDRFAIRTRTSPETVVRQVNAQAFGFQAHRSRDVAVETSRTFAVVSRFQRAIAFITILASGIFLLCLMVLKVQERRREIAALRLIGISPRTIVRAIVLESALVALAGSLFGTLLGWLGALIVNAHYRRAYRTPLLFAIVTPEILLFALVLGLTLGVAAGMLVATRLTRRSPQELLGR